MDVVAAVFRDGEKIMICQRPEGKALALLWEFPGGKVEAGESRAEALVRECREELGVTSEVGELIIELTHAYPHFTLSLSVYEARIVSGKVDMLVHRDIRWVRADELSEYEFCPADEAVLEKLVRK